LTKKGKSLKSKEKDMKKKNMKNKTIYIFLSLIIIIFAGYTIFPHAVAKYYSAKTFKNLDLEVKNLSLGNNKFEYVEGQSGEPMVFFHCFQSTKSY